MYRIHWLCGRQIWLYDTSGSHMLISSPDEHGLTNVLRLWSWRVVQVRLASRRQATVNGSMTLVNVWAGSHFCDFFRGNNLCHSPSLRKVLTWKVMLTVLWCSVHVSLCLRAFQRFLPSYFFPPNTIEKQLLLWWPLSCISSCYFTFNWSNITSLVLSLITSFRIK